MAATGNATLLAVVLVFAAGGARADQPSARSLSDEGLTAYREARYPDAIRSFTRSYQLSPSPLLLFDIAQAHRLSGECAPALEYYQRYLRDAPNAANRATVESHVVMMEECVRAAAPAPVLTPPAPVVTPPAPVAAKPERRPIYKRWWLWTTVGAVAIGAITAGVVVGVTRSGFAPNLPPSGPGAHALSAGISF